MRGMLLLVLLWRNNDKTDDQCQVSNQNAPIFRLKTSQHSGPKLSNIPKNIEMHIILGYTMDIMSGSEALNEKV